MFGKGTEKALSSLGYKADYVGQASDPKKVVQIFDNIFSVDQIQTILFPQSTQSLKSIEKGLGTKWDIKELIVYATKEKRSSFIPENSIAILTSPSNVRAYLHNCEKNKAEWFIAIGNSTANELTKNGITKVLTTKNPTEVGLAEVLFSIL